MATRTPDIYGLPASHFCEDPDVVQDLDLSRLHFSLSLILCGGVRSGQTSLSETLFSAYYVPIIPSFLYADSQTAVVLIEFQNEFATPGGKLYDAVKPCMEQTNTLENSKKLMDAARNAGCTIIHCPICFDPGHNEIAEFPYGILAGVKESAAFTNGEWGADFCETMIPSPGDLIVKGKSGLCGFQSTNLDFLLSQKGIKNVVLGGFLTNCCVESTMRTAYEKGYQVYTLKDCVAATSVEAQNATLEYNFGMFSVATTSVEVLEALQTTIAV